MSPFHGLCNLRMEYLAKVHHKSSTGHTQLQLLAVNSCDPSWELVKPPKEITTTQPVSFNEQVLVLLELDENNTVTSVKDATGWVVSFVSEYLSLGLTSKGLAEELERAEQWRQSLTLQSQEVRRRALETAARRDEIQDLEKRLKLEREALESRD
ncbi:MAG: hypothetical protein AAF703_15160 [Cyanobacteria bacterium P01_D01_bin.105]